MRYTVTIPMTTYYVALVEANSPEAAIAQALDEFDPNNPEHLPKSTEDMGFTLDPKAAEAERDGPVDHNPETGCITAKGVETLRRELQAQLDKNFLQEVARHCARRSR